VSIVRANNASIKDEEYHKKENDIQKSKNTERRLLSVLEKKIDTRT
jgi:hypothetical protein